MLNSKLESSKYLNKNSNTFEKITPSFSISQIFFNKKENIQKNPIICNNKKKHEDIFTPKKYNKGSVDFFAENNFKNMGRADELFKCNN